MSKRERYDDISDDEIRIIGDSGDTRNLKRIVLIVFVALAVVGGILAIVFAGGHKRSSVSVVEEAPVPIYGEEVVPVVVEGVVSHSVLVGMQNGTTTLRDSLEVSYKTKHTLST